MRFHFTVVFLLCAVFLSSAFVAQAQIRDTLLSLPSTFQVQMRAVNASELSFGDATVHLWGVEALENMSAPFQLKARTDLDNIMAGQPVSCDIKSREGTAVFAQCVNHKDLDLGLKMIQLGYASVDRGAVYDSVFEDAYIQAELQAQERKLGIWALSDARGGGGGSSFLGSFSSILFAAALGVFSVLSFLIMRGFQKVIDAQNKNMDLIRKERALREQEGGIIAAMLDTELKANKAKVEAYLVVYEEMLREIKDPDKTPKYKTAGDIVQTQPALERAVFNGNADKLDLLGANLAAQMIHFYAHANTKPEYENLEPETDLADVVSLLEKVLEDGRRLNGMVDDLLEALVDSDLLRKA